MDVSHSDLNTCAFRHAACFLAPPRQTAPAILGGRIGPQPYFGNIKNHGGPLVAGV